MISPHKKFRFLLLCFLALLLISCNSTAILSIIYKIDHIVGDAISTLLADFNKDTETPAAQHNPNDEDKTASPDSLPTEGNLSGSIERQDVNNCNYKMEIWVDLKNRVYSYTLTGGCDYSVDFDIVDIAIGGGGVYGDGYLEGKTTLESTRTCRPRRICNEEWLKGEKYDRNMVGFIDLPASSITICEFDPDEGNGAGWDIFTFRSFSEEMGEFYCPTWPEVFDVVLTP